MKETLNDKELLNKLNEILDDEKSTLKFSLSDKETIKVEEVEFQKNNDKQENKNVKEEKGTFKKLIGSVFRIFESLIDTTAKTFLKKKYKINHSVYNDGKKAVVAVFNNDSKTFFKKATDAVLNLIKKIPTDTKKIIKNTKNVAIDEIYLWNQ